MKNTRPLKLPNEQTIAFVCICRTADACRTFFSLLRLPQTERKRKDDKSDIATAAEKLQKSFFVDVRTTLHCFSNVAALQGQVVGMGHKAVPNNSFLLCRLTQRRIGYTLFGLCSCSTFNVRLKVLS